MQVAKTHYNQLKLNTDKLTALRVSNLIDLDLAKIKAIRFNKKITEQQKDIKVDAIIDNQKIVLSKLLSADQLMNMDLDFEVEKRDTVGR